MHAAARGPETASSSAEIDGNWESFVQRLVRAGLA